MYKLGQRGAIQFVVLLILLAGIAGGIFILKSPENLYNLFRPKAGPGETIAFVDGNGNPVTSIFSASAQVKLTSPTWPTTQSIKKVSLVSEAYAQTNNFTYIDYQVSCSTPSGLTPDQMCQKKGFAKAVAVSGSNAAKGYWWRQCGGASVSSCSGLNCTVNKLDCTNKAGYWGSQQPYRSNYMKGGTAQTVYKPTDLGLSCSGYNPGYTMRVACTNSTPVPTAKPQGGVKPSPCNEVGDVDQDGVVTLADSRAVLSMVVKRAPYQNPTADQKRRADVDGDGQVSSVDALFIQRYVNGLDGTFKVCAKLPSPTPTSAPAPYTTGATLAEDPNFTVNVKNVNMATSSAIVDYTFSSSAAGTKTLYAKFKSSNNREQNANPYPATIKLVSNSVSGPISSTPSPAVTLTINPTRLTVTDNKAKVSWFGIPNPHYNDYLTVRVKGEVTGAATIHSYYIHRNCSLFQETSGSGASSSSGSCTLDLTTEISRAWPGPYYLDLTSGKDFSTSIAKSNDFTVDPLVDPGLTVNPYINPIKLTMSPGGTGQTKLAFKITSNKDGYIATPGNPTSSSSIWYDYRTDQILKGIPFDVSIIVSSGTKPGVYTGIVKGYISDYPQGAGIRRNFNLPIEVTVN